MNDPLCDFLLEDKIVVLSDNEPVCLSFGHISDFTLTLGDLRQAALRATPTPAPAVTGDVRCVGCGSNWTSADLAAAKVADPKIISCCPERQPLDITGWMARAVYLEEKLRQALSRPDRGTGAC